MPTNPKFSAQHYNAIAKEIRWSLDTSLSFHNNWVQLKGGDKKGLYYATEALVVLAINLAKRFEVDNPRFDPLKFLDACSPNTDLYPLSELWEEDDAATH